MVWPLKQNFFSSTFTWYYLYFRILQKMKFGIRLKWVFILDTLGSERVKTAYNLAMSDVNQCSLWNSLPDNIRRECSLISFKHLLETISFQ